MNHHGMHMCTRVRCQAIYMKSTVLPSDRPSMQPKPAKVTIDLMDPRSGDVVQLYAPANRDIDDVVSGVSGVASWRPCARLSTHIQRGV